MTRVMLAPLFGLLSTAMLVFTGSGEMLLSEHLDSIRQTLLYTEEKEGVPILKRWMANPMTLGLLSWLGWGTSFLLMRLGRWGEIYTPLALHPAAILLTAGGYGLAVAALLGLCISIERVANSRSHSSVPSLGLALGAAALAIPGFQAAFLAFTAPLVLIAPRPMLERNILAFFLITLIPAISIMAIALLLDPAPVLETRSASSFEWPPAIAAVPALGLALAAFQQWRIAAILGFISAGAFLSSAGPGDGWPVGLACLAAAFALHRHTSTLGSVLFAASCVLAATVFTRQMSGL